jgi:hypothetical protein
VSPADIVAKARQAGVTMTLDNAGTGLSPSAGSDPPEETVEFVKAAKSDLVAFFQAERGRIKHWIADQFIPWPPDFCLACRKRTLAWPWVEVSNGGATARFHQDCHPEWPARQEVAARKALGLP